MLEGCKRLMAVRFPFLDRDAIDLILHVCAKNNGLSFVPRDEPVYLFGYYRFWPVLAQAVENQDFDILCRADLTHGPLCYVAAFIGPPNSTKVIRRLLQSIQPPPYAFCCHRHNRGSWRFQVKVNSRRFQRVGIQ